MTTGIQELSAEHAALLERLLAEGKSLLHPLDGDPTADWMEGRGPRVYTCLLCGAKSPPEFFDTECRVLLHHALQRARAEGERLKDILHVDRSGLAAALEEVWRTAGGYAWVAEGRGPYEWDDEEYRAEMGRMVRDIASQCQRALEASGDLAHAECCGRGNSTQAKGSALAPSGD